MWRDTSASRGLEEGADTELEHLRCRACGAQLDANSVTLREGGIFVKCPYCGSQRVYGNDEVRVCCIFDHGSKTVLEVEPDEYRTLEPCFTCKDCGRDFIVVYELKEVRRLKEEILGVEGDP